MKNITSLICFCITLNLTVFSQLGQSEDISLQKAQRQLLKETHKKKSNSNRGPGQFFVDTIPNIVPYVISNLFGGCISVTNLSINSAPHAMGYFYDQDTTFGIANGLLLTSGSIWHAKQLPSLEDAISFPLKGLPAIFVNGFAISKFTTS